MKPKPGFILRLDVKTDSRFDYWYSPEQRLRIALKVLLRRFGLVCVEYRPVVPVPVPVEEEAAAK